jgi:hypothetical protein
LTTHPPIQADGLEWNNELNSFLFFIFGFFNSNQLYIFLLISHIFLHMSYKFGSHHWNYRLKFLTLLSAKLMLYPIHIFVVTDLFMKCLIKSFKKFTVRQMSLNFQSIFLLLLNWEIIAKTIETFIFDEWRMPLRWPRWTQTSVSSFLQQVTWTDLSHPF